MPWQKIMLAFCSNYSLKARLFWNMAKIICNDETAYIIIESECKLLGLTYRFLELINSRICLYRSCNGLIKKLHSYVSEILSFKKSLPFPGIEVTRKNSEKARKFYNNGNGNRSKFRRIWKNSRKKFKICLKR